MSSLSDEYKTEWLDRIPEANRIPRVSAEHFIESCYNPKLPCIVTGPGLSEWKCVRWTPEFLQEKFAGYSHSFRYSDASGLDASHVTMPLSDYIQQLFVNNDITEVPSGLPATSSATEKIPYARHIHMDKALEDQVEIDELFPPSLLGKMMFHKFLFIGAVKTKTNNHFDMSDNFVFCVHGIKHVALMPPASEKLMSNIDEASRSKLARGDCFFVDDGANFALDLNRLAAEPDPSAGVQMHQHSVFGSCDQLIYSPLFPGDIVFFPARWYHYFHNVTSTVTITIQTQIDPMLLADEE